MPKWATGTCQKQRHPVTTQRRPFLVLLRRASGSFTKQRFTSLTTGSYSQNAEHSLWRVAPRHGVAANHQHNGVFTFRPHV